MNKIKEVFIMKILMKIFYIIGIMCECVLAIFALIWFLAVGDIPIAIWVIIMSASIAGIYLAHTGTNEIEDKIEMWYLMKRH